MNVCVGHRILERGQCLIVLSEHLEGAQMVRDRQFLLQHLGGAAGRRGQGVSQDPSHLSFCERPAREDVRVHVEYGLSGHERRC